MAARKSKQEKARAYRRLSKYGITPEDHERIMEYQGGTCAICRKAKGISKALAIDHDHATGLVRGELCTRCNVRLGWLEAHYDAAIGYLDSPPCDALGILRRVEDVLSKQAKGKYVV